MRWSGMLVAASLLTGCAGELAERQGELRHWIGQPEAQLVGAMGAPNWVYASGGTKVLTYTDGSAREGSGAPYVFGPGLVGPTGSGRTTYRPGCDTSFTISDGIVKAFSLRGNGCG